MAKFLTKFKKNPSLFYAFSICATWANAGSLLNGVSTAQKNGIVPYLLWAIGNTLACIVFGLLAPKIPKLREVFMSGPMKIVMGIMCPFQCWISMNGIQTVFADTVLGPRAGVIIALCFAVFFIILLWRFGMIRNVLTDDISWAFVYMLVFAVTLIALVTSDGNYVQLKMGGNDIGVGIKNCFLLIPGAFLYPYYFELMSYNESNADETNKVNIQRSFVLGGLLFGVYLVFIFLMSIAVFTPSLNIVKAILVTAIAISSLSSFQYSIYIIFGKGVGLSLNILTAGLWQFLIPLGVMGAWSLMASIRVYIVSAGIICAIIWYLVEKRHGKHTV